MTFDLELEIGGLCAFVPERVSDDTCKMHVLMPATGTGTGHHQHAMRLIHDVAYLNKDAVACTGDLVHVPLDGTSIDLSGLATEPACPLVPELDRVLHLDCITAPGGGVSRDLVTGDPRGRLGGRLTLGAGRATASDFADGARWRYCQRYEEWATAVHWRIQDVVGDSLVFDQTGGTTRQRTLYPIRNNNNRPIIRLTVVNAMPDEIRPLPRPYRTLRPNQAMPHFHAFVGLIRPLPDGEWEPPRIDTAGLVPEDDPAHRHCAADAHHAHPDHDGARDAKAMAYRTATCIVVEASLAPGPQAQETSDASAA